MKTLFFKVNPRTKERTKASVPWNAMHLCFALSYVVPQQRLAAQTGSPSPPLPRPCVHTDEVREER